MSQKKLKIAFHTLGCKLNFSESNTIASQLDSDLFDIVAFREHADIYVIHTCSVTSTADKKSFAFINNINNRAPESKIAIIGCSAHAHAEKYGKMKNVEWVLDNISKFKLADILNSNFGKSDDILDLNSENQKVFKFEPSYSLSERTRCFFKIQDGCDYFCTYCCIPYLRGRSRSFNIKDTMAIAEDIAKTSVKEIVLTGVNIGDFGKNHNENFYDLLCQLSQLDGIERIRISSIEPELLTSEIIELVHKEEKLMPHFHIPLQSGSDKVLKDMKRKYKREVFEEKVRYIKTLMPDACIAADVIVGFPTETEELFEDAFNFINSLEISYLHVFPYSDRELALASKMPVKVPRNEIKLRHDKLQSLSDEKKRIFYKSNMNQTHSVLWESNNSKGYMFGFTDNYVKVRRKYDKSLVNTITSVKLVDFNNDFYNAD